MGVDAVFEDEGVEAESVELFCDRDAFMGGAMVISAAGADDDAGPSFAAGK